MSLLGHFDWISDDDKRPVWLMKRCVWCLKQFSVYQSIFCYILLLLLCFTVYRLLLYGENLFPFSPFFPTWEISLQRSASKGMCTFASVSKQWSCLMSLIVLIPHLFFFAFLLNLAELQLQQRQIQCSSWLSVHQRMGSFFFKHERGVIAWICGLRN